MALRFQMLESHPVSLFVPRFEMAADQRERGTVFLDDLDDSTALEPGALHALIIEDDDLIAGVLEEHLRALGYRSFHHVATERAALAAVALRQPDLILADIVLAVRDGSGIAVAHTVQANAAIPIVFISARPELAQRERMAAVLPKSELSQSRLAAAIAAAKKVWFID